MPYRWSLLAPVIKYIAGANRESSHRNRLLDQLHIGSARPWCTAAVRALPEPFRHRRVSHYGFCFYGKRRWKRLKLHLIVLAQGEIISRATSRDVPISSAI